jgi:hypothetical protein
LSKEAMKKALESLESYKHFVEDAHILEGNWHWIDGADDAITALDEALAEQPAPVQEPVAWMHEWEDGELIPKLHPRDNRKMDKPKSVRPLVYADTVNTSLK